MLLMGWVAFLGGFLQNFAKANWPRGSGAAPSPAAKLPAAPGVRVRLSPHPPFFFFYIYKRQKNKWKAKLAEVFKYFILVSNVNSYIVIAVLGVFRLHVTFVIFL